MVMSQGVKEWGTQVEPFDIAAGKGGVVVNLLQNNYADSQYIR
jgi:hypothetical protein